MKTFKNLAIALNEALSHQEFTGVSFNISKADDSDLVRIEKLIKAERKNRISASKAFKADSYKVGDTVTFFNQRRNENLTGKITILGAKGTKVKASSVKVDTGSTGTWDVLKAMIISVN